MVRKDAAKTAQVRVVDVEDGKYVLMADRYHDFLEKFPPEKFSQTFELIDPLVGLNGQSRVDIYLEALSHGYKPDEMGISLVFPKRGTVWYRITLTDIETGTQIQADALGNASDFKAVERLQTASRQRLIAATGFDSDAYLSDEVKAMEFDKAPIIDEASKDDDNISESQPETDGTVVRGLSKNSPSVKYIMDKATSLPGVKKENIHIPDDANTTAIRKVLKTAQVRVGKGEKAEDILKEAGIWAG